VTQQLFVQSVMESQDLVSASRLISRPIVASLSLEGYRTRSQAYCLETL